MPCLVTSSSLDPSSTDPQDLSEIMQKTKHMVTFLYNYCVIIALIHYEQLIATREKEHQKNENFFI